MPTLREVAQLVGVSPATVSRVLNGYPHISEDVRNNVLDAIDRLGYRPNRVAQRLRAARSNLVGLVVTDITNPFFNLIMSSVETVFFERGFSVLMSNTNADPQKEMDYLRTMENEEIAGLIIAPTSENSSRVVELAERGLPVVVIDRRMDSKYIDSVLSNNVEGAYLAVSHLITLGHRSIAHIGGPHHLTSGRERYEGYRRAMQDAHLVVESGWVQTGDHRHESGYECVLSLLELNPIPTAIFVSNNMMTLGALNAIHDQGIRVPEEVAVVGFDDMPWSISLNPPLTTVAQPILQIGYEAASLLLERINQPDLSARTVVLETQLVVRASCGAKQNAKQRKGG